MAKMPEKLGSEYYRGFLTHQGQAFYDRINAQLLRGDYSGKTTFSICDPETSASDCFAAYKAIRDDHRNSSFWDSRANSPAEGGSALWSTQSCMPLKSLIESGSRYGKKFTVSFAELPIFPCLNEKCLFTSASQKASHTQTAET